MYNNPYYNQTQRYQQMPNFNQQLTTPPYIPTAVQTTGQFPLLGKVVDSMDVVKATDIPLDGSISYFPLTDGSAIVSKQLQNDGTSKTIVYKPVEEKEIEKPKYITIEEVKKEINKIDFSELDDIKDDIKEIKKQLKTMKKVKED